jgi:hypothetical protein
MILVPALCRSTMRLAISASVDGELPSPAEQRRGFSRLWN